MSSAFEGWLRDTYAGTKGFTALIVLIKRDARTVWPLGSTYAHVIGNELEWTDFRRLLDASRQAWDSVVVFPAATPTGGPLSDADARKRLAETQARVIADHATINEGAFFDRRGRPLRLEPE